VFFRNKKEAAIALEKKRIIGKAKIGGRFDLIGKSQTFFIFLLLTKGLEKEFDK